MKEARVIHYMDSGHHHYQISKQIIITGGMLYAWWSQCRKSVMNSQLGNCSAEI